VNLLLVFATEKESVITDSIPGLRREGGRLFYSDNSLNILITGVGGIQTAWALQKWISANPKPDLAINAGIAGSFTDSLSKGDVVMPVSDCFADLGIEIDGKFITLPEAGFADQDEEPFEKGLISCRNVYSEKIRSVIHPVSAVTVNTASGSESSIMRIRKRFNPSIETMEGATFFYICSREKIPFLAVRAISNYVEPGKRGKWEIQLALDNLAGKMDEILKILSET
jgi:futalosine hydrolase